MKRRFDDREGGWFETVLGAVMVGWMAGGVLALMYTLFLMAQWVFNNG